MFIGPIVPWCAPGMAAPYPGYGQPGYGQQAAQPGYDQQAGGYAQPPAQ
jgi:hypothetical protein